MAKIRDLSPKLSIPVAEVELQLAVNQTPMAQQRGGLNLYSNKFKRGYGDAVFGSDENGIWLGAAEFADAPFRVNMAGSGVFSGLVSGSLVVGNNKVVIDGDSTNPAIRFYDDLGNVVIFIGEL